MLTPEEKEVIEQSKKHAPDNTARTTCLYIAVLGTVVIGLAAWKALELLGYFVKWFMGWL